MSRLDLFRRFRTDQDVVEFFWECDLLIFEPDCPVCHDKMQYASSSYSYRCYNGRRGERCNQEIAITYGTIFYRMRLSYLEILFLLYEFSIGTPVFRTVLELRITECTVLSWYDKLSEITAEHIMALFAIIVGDGIIVEIDECKLVKKKYHRGRNLAHEGKWLFGGIEKDSGKCFFEFVNKRDRETLLEIIRRRILPGSIVYSDEWELIGI